MIVNNLYRFLSININFIDCIGRVLQLALSSHQYCKKVVNKIEWRSVNGWILFLTLPPPTCLPADTTLLCEADDRTCEGTAEFSPQYVSVPVLDANKCIRPSENITEDTRGISLLAKKMLKRAGTDENVTTTDYPNGKNNNVKVYNYFVYTSFPPRGSPLTSK